MRIWSVCWGAAIMDSPPRRRYQRYAWTEHEEKLLGSMPDADLARQLGVKIMTVGTRRRALGVAPFHVNKSNLLTKWGKDELALLGKMPDAAVALRVNKSANTVSAMRVRRGIAPYERHSVRWKRAFLTWDKAVAMSAPDFFRSLQERYAQVGEGKLTHRKLAGLSLYSLSRVQKWFTAGTAQEPLTITTRHHLWLIARLWGSNDAQ